MPSSSSGSSSEASSSPAPTRKKRPPSDSCDNKASSTSGEDLESDTPHPLPIAETTVLSHAQRRRQKKKQRQQQQQLASASLVSPRKKRKLDDGTPSNVDADTQTMIKSKSKSGTKVSSARDDSRRLKRQNSIWVGNLSFRTTQDALRSFFDGVGKITRIHMPIRRGNDSLSENMGFAYVDFDTPNAKVIAVTLSEGQLDGRNLLIKDGGDFTGRPANAKAAPSEGAGEGNGKGENAVMGGRTEQSKGLSKTAQKILRAQKQPPAPTLFLGNLGFETTEESIWELFEAHRYWEHKGKGKGDVKAEKDGEGGDAETPNDVWIRRIRMGTFEDSGNCKGFAFVDFTSTEYATEALVNPRNRRLNGRDLVVEYASPDAARRGGSRHSKGDGDRKSKSRDGSRKGQRNGSMNAPFTKQRKCRYAEKEDGAEAAETPVESVSTPRLRQLDHAGYDRSYARRTKPGAALAHAQRQSAAILPSQGQKIVF